MEKHHYNVMDDLGVPPFSEISIFELIYLAEN